MDPDVAQFYSKTKNKNAYIHICLRYLNKILKHMSTTSANKKKKNRQCLY